MYPFCIAGLNKFPQQIKSSQPNIENTYHHSSASIASGSGSFPSRKHVELKLDHWEDVTIIPKSAATISHHHHHNKDSDTAGGYHHRMHSHNSPSNARQYQWYMISGLQAASNYEARVYARNIHGWNGLSNVFYFSTHPEDGE